jgi:hypothetical protein
MSHLRQAAQGKMLLHFAVSASDHLSILEESGRYFVVDAHARKEVPRDEALQRTAKELASFDIRTLGDLLDWNDRLLGTTLIEFEDEAFIREALRGPRQVPWTCRLTGQSR